MAASYVSPRRPQRRGTRLQRAAVASRANGAVELSLVTVVDWNETELAAIHLPGTYTPGSVLTMRIEIDRQRDHHAAGQGLGEGTAEPADWMVTATDTTASLQGPVAIDTEIYQSGSATTPTRTAWTTSGSARRGDPPAV